MKTLSSETLHASCVAIGGQAVLIEGRSGSGKSDLALRLIDRGATLVSDDYTLVKRSGARLLAAAPPHIEGKIEVRGLGILELPVASDVPVALIVNLEDPVERFPEKAKTRKIVGLTVPLLPFDAFEASTPLKVEQALCLFGLPPA